MRALQVIFSYIFCITFITFSCESKKENPIDEGASEIQELTLTTSDSLTIFGDLYTATKAAPTVLLFHQGGSNARAEYEPIIPKLIAKGFNVLAIDLRVGGQIYGNYNRTVAKILNSDYGYCDAYPDLEAALKYLIENNFTGPKIAWGSSYSASLAIQLAHNNPQTIDAVLAFSPASGQQLQDCLPNTYFETLKVPLLLLRPDTEAEYESVKEQLQLAESFNHQTYVAANGVHGSSMLVEQRTKSSVNNTLNTVIEFLEKYNN